MCPSEPVLLLPLAYSIYISVGIGLMLLVGLGYFVSKINNKFKPHKLAAEYLLIGVSVSIICYFIGIIAEMTLNSIWKSDKISCRSYYCTVM